MRRPGRRRGNGRNGGGGGGSSTKQGSDSDAGTTTTLRRLFQLAAFVNIAGILIMTSAFTSTRLSDVDAGTFSTLSATLVILWGLAYYGTSTQVLRVPWVCCAFAIEKIIYAMVGIQWQLEHASELPQMWSDDWRQGLFFTTYPLNDALFAVVFAYGMFAGLSRQLQQVPS